MKDDPNEPLDVKDSEQAGNSPIERLEDFHRKPLITIEREQLALQARRAIRRARDRDLLEMPTATEWVS